MKASSVKLLAGPLVLSTLASMFTVCSVFAEDPHDRGPSQISIHVWDYCDPATFNAALGDGTCNRDTATGAITVNGFLGEVASDKSAGAWRFSPDQVSSDHQPLSIILKNMGGETHTFTKVKKFGGGFVDALNQASGNPVPAPECAQLVNGVLTPQAPGADNLFIPAGSSAMASTSPARRSTSLSVLYSSMDAFCGERRRPRPSSIINSFNPVVGLQKTCGKTLPAVFRKTGY